MKLREPITVEFGEYLPDLPAYRNPGATIVKNVLPAGNSYRPFASMSVTVASGLAARCQGATSALDNDGNVFNFAGDASKLYSFDASTWSDVSAAGGYTTGSQERWHYTKFGSLILATNFSDPIQKWLLGTDTEFSDLGGTPPQARSIATVRDFVVVGDTFDGVDGNKPFRVRWCGQGDEESWAIDAATQADFQDLNGYGGSVKQIIGGEYGTVFQEYSIWRMTYIASPAVFQFDEVEPGRGTPAAGSVVRLGVGGQIGYLSQKGFCIFNGQYSEPIGANKIDKTFYADLDQNYMNRIYSAVDPINQIIFWSYPGSGNTNGRPNRILAFNYSSNATKRWTYSEVDTEALYVSLANGYTLDGLDDVSGSIDALSASLDSRLWTGGAANLSAFDSNNYLNRFTGAALDGTIETGEYELFSGARADVTLVRPLVDGAATVTTAIGGRVSHADSNSYNPASTRDAYGFCTARCNSRFQRAKVTTSGEFSHAQGIEIIDASRVGRR